MSENGTTPKTGRNGVPFMANPDFRQSGLWDTHILFSITNMVKLERSDFRQLGPSIRMIYSPNFRQTKVSEIGTVWEWGKSELSEIQTSSIFRHSL